MRQAGCIAQVVIWIAIVIAWWADHPEAMLPLVVAFLLLGEE